MTIDQVPTSRTTFRKIMSRVAFALGVADVRAGKPYRPDFDSWSDIDAQWNYERGRQWAVLAPRNIRLKCGRKITDEAWLWTMLNGDDIADIL
jgi:hypothetical protein